MNLTREEFCLFNTASRIKFLKKDGRFLNSRSVGQNHGLFLYLNHNFYVEMLVDLRTRSVVTIDPVVNKEGLTLYREKPA